jgi:hypothetical protein
MPRGTGSLYSGLQAKRRELEQAIETVDAAIRLIHGKASSGRSKPRGPMSEETKAKLRAAHARRKRQEASQSSRQPNKGRRPLGVRTRPKEQAEAVGA